MEPSDKMETKERRVFIVRHIVAKETDFEEWDASCRAEQCCMIIYDLYFTVVDIAGELRLRVSLQENENAYLDFIRRNKEFEVVRRKDIADIEYWRIRFYVEHNKEFLIKDMLTEYYIVDKKTERQPIPMKQEDIEKIKKDYPKNTIIILNEDMYSDGVKEDNMHKNLTGRVSFVDDAGQIHVKWQNGRGLALIPGIDNFQKVNHFIKAYDLLKVAFDTMQVEFLRGTESKESAEGYFDRHFDIISKVVVRGNSINGIAYQDESIDRKILNAKIIAGYWLFDYIGHDGEFYASYFTTYNDSYSFIVENMLQGKGVEGMGLSTDILIIHNTEVQFYLSIYNKDQIKL